MYNCDGRTTQWLMGPVTSHVSWNKPIAYWTTDSLGLIIVTDVLQRKSECLSVFDVFKCLLSLEARRSSMHTVNSKLINTGSKRISYFCLLHYTLSYLAWRTKKTTHWLFLWKQRIQYIGQLIGLSSFPETILFCMLIITVKKWAYLPWQWAV